MDIGKVRCDITERVARMRGRILFEHEGVPTQDLRR